MPDYTHAIARLRWLIREDFYDRNRGVRTALDLDLNERPERVMWWQSRMGREDVASVRSFIAAVRVLEAAAKPPTPDPDIAETAKRIALTDRGIYPACLEGARGDCEMCADMAARIASAIQAERDRADELDHLASVRRADLVRALRERDEWQANAENAVRKHLEK